MKWFFLASLICMSGDLFAQTTRKITKNIHQNLREEFYVSNANPGIREGRYKAMAAYGDWLRCEGFYRNNMKDSLWKYYGYMPDDSSERHFTQFISSTGSYKNDRKIGTWVNYDYSPDSSQVHYVKYISSTGSYADGQMTGAWNYYDRKGIRLKYDFNNKKALFYRSIPKDTLKFLVINGTDSVITTLDHPPIYADGPGYNYKAMGKNLKYPKAALEANISGKVLIAFTVDKKGKAINFRIKKDIGYGCGEAALYAVQHMDGDWIPAELQGQPITVIYEMPVSFEVAINH